MRNLNLKSVETGQGHVTDSFLAQNPHFNPVSVLSVIKESSAESSEAKGKNALKLEPLNEFGGLVKGKTYGKDKFFSRKNVEFYGLSDKEEYTVEYILKDGKNVKITLK